MTTISTALTAAMSWNPWVNASRAVLSSRSPSGLPGRDGPA
ncbi:hypothetical protein [Micromonospora craterilacus]|nr:hypothetical protein [Micromonospora craterilacus]